MAITEDQKRRMKAGKDRAKMTREAKVSQTGIEPASAPNTSPKGVPGGALLPGTILNRGLPTESKVHWTRRAIEETYGKVTFTPNETIPVCVNGVTYQLSADREITVPSIVKDVYDQHRAATRQGEWNKHAYFGSVGVGAVPEGE